MSVAFADGLLLVFLPTNLLALVALGLLAGRRRIVLGVLLALGLLIGSFAIASAMRDPPAAAALLMIAVLAGIIVAAAWQPPLFVTGILALAGGAALALNAPPQAITLGAAIASQLGTGFGALIAFAVVTTIAAAARRPWHRIALRIFGSWIAASAILALALKIPR